jgi:HTH-type transcriptional regulator, sugar sensing transcriptional regulator
MDIQEYLENIGFTNNEAKVFLVLYKGKNMTAAEVAKEAGMQRTSVYEILKSFAEEGICNEIQTTTKMRYEMIDPDVVKDKISRSIKSEQEKKIEYLNESFEKLKPLFGRDQQGSVTEQVELIKGFNKHRHIKFVDLLKNAKKEVLIMNRLEGYVSGELDEVGINFIKKGGVVKSIYEGSGDFKLLEGNKWVSVSDENLVNLYQSFEDYGEEIRVTKTITQNITIFDREIVFINLIDKNIPGSERTDIVVYNKNFAEYSAQNFLNLWDNSETLKEFEKRVKIDGHKTERNFKEAK